MPQGQGGQLPVVSPGSHGSSRLATGPRQLSFHMFAFAALNHTVEKQDNSVSPFYTEETQLLS